MEERLSLQSPKATARKSLLLLDAASELSSSLHLLPPRPRYHPRTEALQWMNLNTLSLQNLSLTFSKNPNDRSKSSKSIPRDAVVDVPRTVVSVPRCQTEDTVEKFEHRETRYYSAMGKLISSSPSRIEWGKGKKSEWALLLQGKTDRLVLHCQTNNFRIHWMTQ